MKQAGSRLSPAASNGERLRPRRGKWHSTMFWKTNLPDTAGRVLELDRARWQIECVFHRLKGLFSFGEPLGTNPDSVRAWRYAKLFLAALCEAVARQTPFSSD